MNNSKVVCLFNKIFKKRDSRPCRGDSVSLIKSKEGVTAIVCDGYTFIPKPNRCEKKISLPIRVYDCILFNYEGEKRVDIVTSIETHKAVDSYTLVYNTCCHGLINDFSVERNFGSIE